MFLIIKVNKNQPVIHSGFFFALGIQSQVLGSIWTLKHLRILDLLHQQLQEVLPGRVPAQEDAGKWSLQVAFEAEQREKAVSEAAGFCRQPTEGDKIT